MMSPKPSFIFKATKRFASWQPILVITLLYVFSHGINLYRFRGGAFQTLYSLRICHILICLTVIIFILIKKNAWKPKYGLPLFLMTLLPAYLMSWYYIETYVHLKEIFAPFNVIRLHLFLLVFLVPSSYWINFCMMVGFALEAVIAWLYFDLPHLEHIAMGGEPTGLIASFAVSITILFFRFRDEQIIRALITNEARSEVVSQIARTFLSIRDRANTPLQTLTLSIELYKKRHPEDVDLIKIFESNTDRLKMINKFLTSLENQIPWQGNELMTDEEILAWLSEFKKYNTDSLLSDNP